MRKFLLALSAVLLTGFNSQAADVVCGCSGEQKCSDIEITFVPSNPGVYMTIKYAYGEVDREGFATVTRDKQTGNTTYQMGGFWLVQDSNNKFKLPQKPHNCNS